MTRQDVARLRAERDELIQYASARGLHVYKADFKLDNGSLTLDGMDAKQWIDDMTEGDSSMMNGDFL